MHTFFTPEHVKAARKKEPNGLIVVHPECSEDVVNISDVIGSTTKIVATAAEAPDGSTLFIGTEINLVDRISREYAGRKTILPLARSFCPNMFRINLFNLLESLENLGADSSFKVDVPVHVARDAKKALERMLEVS